MKIPLDVKKKLIFRAINGNTRQHHEVARNHETQIIGFFHEFMNDDDILEYLLSSENDYLRQECFRAFLCHEIVSMFQFVYNGKKNLNDVLSSLDRWHQKHYFQHARIFSNERWKNYLMTNLRNDHLEMLVLLAEGLS